MTEICSCCDRAGLPAEPNSDSSEWVCDCACHFGWQREDEMKIIDLSKRLEKAHSENESLRHFIEDRIMDDKGWRQEYNEFLDKLNEDDL